jgi:hypothetical protein
MRRVTKMRGRLARMWAGEGVTEMGRIAPLFARGCAVEACWVTRRQRDNETSQAGQNRRNFFGCAGSEVERRYGRTHIRRLLMKCAEDSERSQKLCEEARLLVMKAQIVRARVKANMKKREQVKRSGDQK